MFNLKQTLQQYQSVFVLGLPNHETYRIFRSLLTDAVKGYMPVSYMDISSNKTFILFNHSDEVAYVESCQRLVDLTRNESSLNDSNTIFLSVADSKLPQGFVFIIPPQFTSKNFMAEHHSNPFFMDDKKWLKRFYGVLWCDAFPYGQLSNGKIINGLSSWLISQYKSPNVKVMLIEGPSMSISDLVDSDDNINSIYTNGMLCKPVKEVNDDTDFKNYFKARFKHRKSYLESQKDFILQQVSEMEAFILEPELFNTAYTFCVEDFIYDYLSPQCIDKVFSQRSFQTISHKSECYQYLLNFKEELIRQFTSHLESDFFDEYSMPYLNLLGSVGYTLPVKNLHKQINEEKLSWMKAIGTNLNFHQLKNLSPLEYIEEIKDNKKEFTALLVIFFEKKCREILFNFLSGQIKHLKSIGK